MRPSAVKLFWWTSFLIAAYFAFYLAIFLINFHSKFTTAFSGIDQGLRDNAYWEAMLQVRCLSRFGLSCRLASHRWRPLDN